MNNGVTEVPGLRRIAMLTDIPFWNVTLGSHARVTALLRAICSIANVTIFSFQHHDELTKQQFDHLELRANLVSFSDWSDRQEHFVSDVSEHEFFKKASNPSWILSASSFLRTYAPDFVIIEYIDRSFLLDAVPSGVRTILDAHDVMSERSLNFSLAGKKSTINISANHEKQIISRYSAVLAISSQDLDRMRFVLGLSNVIYTPHPAPLVPKVEIRERAKNVLMVGGLSVANVSGLKWFLDQVWPLVRNDLCLYIAGTVCESVENGLQNVKLCGIVPDLAELHGECDIAINPVFVGGGLKLKTLEAMGYGLPCVTTIEGARGLNNAIGKGIMVARSRLDFVNCILKLTSSQQLRHSLSVAAQSYVASYHSPTLCFNDLKSFINHA